MSTLYEQFEEIFNLVNEIDTIAETDPQKAWQIGIEKLGSEGLYDWPLLYTLGEIALFKLNDLDKAYRKFNEFLSHRVVKRRLLSRDYYYGEICDMYLSRANYYSSLIIIKKDGFNVRARNLMFDAAKGNKEVQYNEDELLWEHVENKFRTLEKEYFGENLATRPYIERKLIFPVNNLFNLTTISHDQVFPVELDSLLANHNLQFPLTHPQPNQLYVAHPYNPNIYLLYDNYEIDILQDKLREFSEIAQALGAIEIDVKIINNSAQHIENNNYTYLFGTAAHSVASVEVNQTKKRSNKEEYNFEHMFNRHQTFAPKSTISQPQNTVWLQGEPSWQRLIKQRLEGGLTSHREVIETKSSRVISGSASNQLKGEIQSIFADLNLNWNKNEESRYSEHSNLVLSVDIKFSNIQPGNQILPPPVSNSLTTEELEYKEEYEACLADGEIATSERRLLDRLANKLGLSQEQVKKIEESAGDPLTDEEKEYLDEYRACLADDPELSSSTRRLLSKMAKSLGLTEEQVNKLENLK